MAFRPVDPLRRPICRDRHAAIGREGHYHLAPSVQHLYSQGAPRGVGIDEQVPAFEGDGPRGEDASVRSRVHRRESVPPQRREACAASRVHGVGLVMGPDHATSKFRRLS